MNLTRANLVLAAAAVVLAVPTWMTLQREAGTFKDVASVPRLFEGFTSDLAASLALGEPKKDQPAPPPNADPNQKPPLQYDQLTFQRTDKGFVFGAGMGELTGAPVNRELLDVQVWKHLTEIRADKESLVQPDATDEQLAQYGLDQPHAFVVKAANGNGEIIAELLVGKDSAQGQSGADAVRGVFVRRADSRDVVLYETPFWQRSLKSDTWLDRAVIKVPVDKVRVLTLRNKTGEVTFKRPAGQTQWTCEKPPTGRAAVRQVEVEPIVQRCGFITAMQFLKPLQTATLNAFGLEPPVIEVTLTYEQDGQDKVASFGIGNPVDGKSENYLRSSQSSFAMTIAAHMLPAFEKDLSELFDPATPTGEGTDPKAAPGNDAPKDGAKDVPKKGG